MGIQWTGITQGGKKKIKGERNSWDVAKQSICTERDLKYKVFIPKTVLQVTIT